MNTPYTFRQLSRAIGLVMALGILATATAQVTIGVDPDRQVDPEQNLELRYAGFGITAYPNPFNEYMFVQTQGVMGKPIRIELRSAMDGSLVLEQNLIYTDAVQLNTTTIPYGHYILTVMVNNGIHVGSREVRRANVR